MEGITKDHGKSNVVHMTKWCLKSNFQLALLSKLCVSVILPKCLSSESWFQGPLISEGHYLSSVGAVSLPWPFNIAHTHKPHTYRVQVYITCLHSHFWKVHQSWGIGLGRLNSVFLMVLLLWIQYAFLKKNRKLFSTLRLVLFCNQDPFYFIPVFYRQMFTFKFVQINCFPQFWWEGNYLCVSLVTRKSVPQVRRSTDGKMWLFHTISDIVSRLNRPRGCLPRSKPHCDPWGFLPS